MKAIVIEITAPYNPGELKNISEQKTTADSTANKKEESEATADAGLQILHCWRVKERIGDFFTFEEKFADSCKVVNFNFLLDYVDSVWISYYDIIGLVQKW